VSFVRLFLRDSAIYTVPTIISRGLSFLLIPIYTRVLSPANYGSFDLLMLYGSLVSATIVFQVSQGVGRFYADEQDDDRKVLYASSAFWFTVFCYTVFSLLTFHYSSQLASIVMGRDGLQTCFRIGVVYIWLNGIFYLIQNQFRWELRSKHYAIVSVIMTFGTASLAVTMAYILEWGLAGLLYGMVGGVLMGCIYGLYHLRNSFRFRFNWNRLKEMLIFSAPLVPAGIAVFISQYIDRLMINHYLSLKEVGLYVIGFRFAAIMGLLVMGTRGALSPLIYTHYRSPETPRQLAQIFRLFIAFALLLFLILSVFIKEILVLMTTPNYYSAGQIVIYLMPAILLSNMYIFAPGIMIAKKTHLIFWINIFGAALHTLFNWLLIPAFGISGAALATLLGYLCTFWGYMLFSQRLYYVPYEWKRVVAATVVFGLLAYFAPKVSIGLGWVIALKIAVVFAGIFILIFSGMIRKAEFHQVKTLISKYFLVEVT
jgi:O-antigen/teichoic acid export membrane protein